MNYYKEKARIEILAKKKKEKKLAQEYTKILKEMYEKLNIKSKKD
jgi:hypothetical protein